MTKPVGCQLAPRRYNLSHQVNEVGKRSHLIVRLGSGDRKGRTLSYDDVTHSGKIVVALKETIRLITEIDEVIPSWPIQ